MNEIKDFKKVKLSKTASSKIVGGNGGSAVNEDVPITDLGTVTNDGDL